jgi:hypothetical protein
MRALCLFYGLDTENMAALIMFLDVYQRANEHEKEILSRIVVAFPVHEETVTEKKNVETSLDF